MSYLTSTGSEAQPESSDQLNTDDPSNSLANTRLPAPKTAKKPFELDPTAIPTTLGIHMSFFSGMDSKRTDQGRDSQDEEVRTTPLFSGSVLEAFGSGLLPQYGLLAAREQNFSEPKANSQDTDCERGMNAGRIDPRIFLNVNTPWSAFICGSQGAGKSHTLSCMLESCLLLSQIGELSKPLAAMVFHYDPFTSFASSQLCEAAFLCSSGTPVRVLVSATNYWRMKEIYQNLPGVPADKMPEVIPLRFEEQQLNVSRMMNLMAVNKNDGPMPLYIEVILRILRAMSIESKGAPGLNYAAFRNRLALEGFSGQQNVPLKLRLELLESFMEEPPKQISRPEFSDTKAGRKAAREWDATAEELRQKRDAKAKVWSFEPGSLTIVDLSCPFVDDSAACALFTICLELFLENRGSIGRVLALDEAHKYMTGTDSASMFTETLLQVIRQQRHLATRVIIATQEPTVSPKLLDLCTMTIVHRFTSPDWFTSLRTHLAGVFGVDGESQRDAKEIFKAIVNLRAGEALLFSGTAMLEIATTTTDQGTPVVEKLGSSYVKMRVRKRLTVDGGRSIMAV
ncbi:hypothetical protein MMC30_002786 [Trapelia coarctata]|nr:hypothetical protein [Trapelia coarctata]